MSELSRNQREILTALANNDHTLYQFTDDQKWFLVPVGGESDYDPATHQSAESLLRRGLIVMSYAGTKATAYTISVAGRGVLSRG